MNVSDEVLDVAANVFCQRYYTNPSPATIHSTQAAMRAALKAVLLMLNKSEPVAALAVTDEVVERAARAHYDWAKEFLGYVYPWEGIGEKRQVEIRGEARATLEAAMPTTDEERLRAALALCKASLPEFLEYFQAYHCKIDSAVARIEDALSLMALPSRPKMRLVYQVETCDHGHLAWYDRPDGLCETRIFHAGQEVPQEIEVPE